MEIGYYVIKVLCKYQVYQNHLKVYYFSILYKNPNINLL